MTAPKVSAEPSASAIAEGDDDPFYTPPEGYENTTPGTILRSRPVVVKALDLFPVHAQSWQLLYRTTDSDGSPYASVTTVMIPEGAPKSRALLSYHMAYDSMQRACMPSYSLLNSNPMDIFNAAKESAWALPSIEFVLTASALAKGYAVSIPDASGIDNHFLTPRVMGYTALDGIRAAENFAPLGLPGTATTVAMGGYSGGGITTDWAAELQQQYAPELNITGAAIGGPVADLAAALHTANGRLLGGLLPIGMAALAKDSEEFASRLDGYLTPLGRAVVAGAGRECVGETVLKNMFRRVDDMVTVPMAQILADPVIHEHIAERARGTVATPTMPLYVFNGLNDEVSPIAPVDAMVGNYCADGASITYVRDALPDLLSDHTLVMLTGAGGMFAWLDKALSGQPIQPEGCRTTTVPSTLADAANLTALPDFARTAIQMMLGQSLGR
ncbi:lipase family protein [Nocardia transvalensis]|uniref:lipase family protein n=1 Tax=Nocardia transvalensis TaxID=37333 RepID=UPI001895FAEE|nr:lipase family protein [Nocardia transvalensis]MBF6329092.1 triacylglycerol lipase [Nocardia transvalensis]